jgi:hypothetical protein
MIRPLRPHSLSLLSVLVSCLTLAPSFAHAESVKAACPDLEKCAYAVAALTGDRLVFDPGILKGPIRATENLELTKEDAEIIFTQMLNQNGLTRLPLEGAKAYTILRQRDARDSALPRFDADSKTAPALPKTWDLAILRYRLAHPELAEPIARNIRSFLPGTARVIPDELSGHLLITAAEPILGSVLNLIQSMDVKVSKAILKSLAERRREHRSAERSAPPSRPDSPTSEAASHH